MALFFEEFNVLEVHIRPKMNRGEVIGGQSSSRKGERGMVEVEVAQIGNVQHRSQPFLSFGLA